MNPCKLCIVRACCSQECRTYRVFRENASHIITFISVFLSGILVAIPLIYLLDVHPNKEYAKNIIQYIWFISIAYNLIFKYRFKLKGSAIFEIFFGPFCTSIYTFMFIGAKIFKRV